MSRRAYRLTFNPFQRLRKRPSRFYVPSSDEGSDAGVGYVGQDQDFSQLGVVLRNIHNGFHAEGRGGSRSAINGVVIGNIDSGYVWNDLDQIRNLSGTRR